MTLTQLQQLIVGNTNPNEWYNSLMKYLPYYDINTNKRIAAFMAECCVETGNFTHLKENLNYSAAALVKVWPIHFPNMTVALKYEHKPDAIANRAYANRMGNGDESSGDGSRYLGRGLIQVTGKSNYQLLATDLHMNIADLPHFLVTYDGAVQSACLFWKRNKLNTWADQGNIDEISKVINGGTNGLKERHDNYIHALTVLGN